jgi:MFS family permease
MSSEMKEKGPPLNFVQWTVCVIASIGFAFDTYELLMAPLIMRPAMEAFQIPPQEREMWFGIFLYVPTLAGGVFGLLGGYLTDLWGRRRVLVYSILLYAGSAFAAGFATSMEMLLFLRCTTLIGVCVEFVAAVAWLAELFPNPRQRESVLGFTQAFASFGGILVTGANYLAVHYREYFPAIHGVHEAWRYTLISGVIPALPLILIRPFLPESTAWAEKKKAGTLRRPSIANLFSPELRRTTIVTTLMFACSYGVAYGALQHTPRIVPDLPQVSAQVQAASADKDEAEQKKLQREIPLKIAAEVNGYQEIGGLLGRFALAALALIIVGRRALIRVFQIPGLILIPLIYVFPARDNLELLKWGMLAAGFLTIAQFSFWGNYLPRVYPLHLRGTGEGFAANIGGRVLGASAAMVTTTLTPHFKSTALAAAAVVLFVYAAGFILSFWLPEPKSEHLME